MFLHWDDRFDVPLIISNLVFAVSLRGKYTQMAGLSVCDSCPLGTYGATPLGTELEPRQKQRFCPWHFHKHLFRLLEIE